MKICLAGTCSRDFLHEEVSKSKYLLESFWYFQPWQVPLLKSSELFLIDSGAFTFMNTVKGTVDWNEYLDRYIAFINKYNIKHFFELDVDSITGYDTVKKLRAKLEHETGKKSIPVWHVSRGKEEFIKMCQEYDYVACGGLVTKEMSPETAKKYLPWFVKTAHSYGTKIHGLGFTNLKELSRINFDSVDSTSWLAGARFGTVYRFNGKTISTHKAPTGYKTAHYKQLDLNNLREWIKFQDYADRCL